MTLSCLILQFVIFSFELLGQQVPEMPFFTCVREVASSKRFSGLPVERLRLKMDEAKDDCKRRYLTKV